MTNVDSEMLAGLLEAAQSPDDVDSQAFDQVRTEALGVVRGAEVNVHVGAAVIMDSVCGAILCALKEAQVPDAEGRWDAQDEGILRREVGFTLNLFLTLARRDGFKEVLRQVADLDGHSFNLHLVRKISDMCYRAMSLAIKRYKPEAGGGQEHCAIVLSRFFKDRIAADLGREVEVNFIFGHSKRGPRRAEALPRQTGNFRQLVADHEDELSGENGIVFEILEAVAYATESGSPVKIKEIAEDYGHDSEVVKRWIPVAVEAARGIGLEMCWGNGEGWYFKKLVGGVGG